MEFLSPALLQLIDIAFVHFRDSFLHFFLHLHISEHHLGDNCIQYFHLGRYIVGNTVGNLVLQ